MSGEKIWAWGTIAIIVAMLLRMGPAPPGFGLWEVLGLRGKIMIAVCSTLVIAKVLGISAAGYNILCFFVCIYLTGLALWLLVGYFTRRW